MNKILGTKSTQNPERRSGNTTRLLNEAVEDLFNGKTCYVIFENRQELNRFAERLDNRFKEEHKAAPATLGNEHTRWHTYALYRLLYEIGESKGASSFYGITFENDDERSEIENAKAILKVKLQHKTN